MAVVVCNGLPKTGTHALLKCVELLGVPHARDHMEHGHWPHGYAPEGKHICIFRDPRNVLVSWVRFARNEAVSAGFLMAAIRAYYSGESFVAEAGMFTPYLSDPNALAVRFEDLLSDGGASVIAIAGFIGVPEIPDVYESIPGMTVTYTGALSVWQDHWTDQVDAVWQEEGGPQLLADWGYS